MSVNKNWARWAVASIGHHFKNSGPMAGMSLFYEYDIRTSDPKEGIELRIDGPVWNEEQGRMWKGRFEINCLVRNFPQPHENVYNTRKMMGNCEATFDSVIEVNKRGGQPEDDNSFVGCLRRTKFRGTDNEIVSSYFGRIEPDTREEQGTVEAHYILELEED